MTTKQTLDERAKKAAKEIIGMYSYNLGDVPKHMYDKYSPRAEASIVKAIKAEFSTLLDEIERDVVGEDIDPTTTTVLNQGTPDATRTTYQDDHKVTQNGLKAVQRQALNQLREKYGL